MASARGYDIRRQATSAAPRNGMVSRAVIGTDVCHRKDACSEGADTR